MFQFIIQTIAFQLFFLLVYDFFLKKETFFNWNRVYLLGTAFLSLFIPLIKIESFKNVVSPEYIITLPEVLLGNSQQTEAILLNEIVVSNSFGVWKTVFLVGVFLALILFGYKLFSMLKMLIKNPKQRVENFRIVNLINSKAAFSFFRYIFLGNLINEEEKESIINHELVHVNQYHSVDLLLFEVLRILFWFNPLIYMYQNRMVALHEFIADAHAVNPENKKEYYQNLLSQVFETKRISFINPFFKQSLIKKRIVMLTKTRSKYINLLKYALLIPLVFGMLIYSSCQKQNDKEIINEIDLKQYSYKLKIGQKEMPSEVKIVHDNFETFLKQNSNYVAWVIFDEETKSASYSVHSINDKLPKEFSEEPWVVNFPNGSSYKSYHWFKQQLETEESRKRKAEELRLLREKYKDSLEVPFMVLDKVPLYPGCEDLSNEEMRKCMSKKISMYVNRNFNTELATELNLTGRQRINVLFKIDKEGNVTGVRSRAPHPALEQEAIRVINSLPKMIPGENNGKKVIVPYSLPIIFQVADDLPEVN